VLLKEVNMAKKTQRTGAKDGGGNFYPSQASIADPGYSPIHDGVGTGAKDGGGELYGDASKIHALESQPVVKTKGTGSKSRGNMTPGSLKRMEDTHNAFKSEDRRFRGGKG
jgi:hypothetical protein